MDAGIYSTPFSWEQYTTTKNTDNGQRVPSFPADGTLWGELKESVGSEDTELGGVRASTLARITLRNRVPVIADDRLRDKNFDLTYRVTGVSYRDNETVIEAIRRQAE